MPRPRRTLTHRLPLAAASLMVCLSAAEIALGQSVNLAPPAPLPVTTMPDAGPPATSEPDLPIDDTVAFNRTERWMIPRYFEKLRGNQARASRAKKYQRVPPEGVAKVPQKGDVLPPTAVALLHRLPAPLVRDLPPVRPDTVRLVAGTDVLLLRRSSGEVLDVLTKVIP